MQIDLTKMTNDQLAILASLVPETVDGVKEELELRTAFPSLESAFSSLAAVSDQLENFLLNTRHTASVRTIVNMGLVPLFRSMLATARVNHINYEKPTLEKLIAS